MSNAAQEIEAMRACWAALCPLDALARTRCLQWLRDYSATWPDPVPQPPPGWPVGTPPPPPGSHVKVSL